MASAMASLSLPSSQFLQRDLGRFRPPVESSQKSFAHKSVVRAGLKFHTRELKSGYTLFTFFTDDTADDESTQGSHPSSRAHYVAAFPELPPRRPSSFTKASPVFPQQRRQKTQLAEIKQRMSKLSAISAFSSATAEVLRLPSAFSKPSPVAASVGRNASSLKGRLSRHMTKATHTLGLLSSRTSFQKRSPVADGKVREARRKVEQDATNVKAPSTRVSPAASHLPRLPSEFRKRSPVLEFRSRPTEGDLKGKRGERLRSTGIYVPTTQLPARPPSLFKKQSPVVKFKLRGMTTMQRPFASRAPVVVSLTSTEEGRDEESPVPTPQNIPERQLSSFRRRRRPLPSSHGQIPRSQLPVQSQPNGSEVYDKLPEGIPLNVHTPALMDGLRVAHSAADRLSFSGNPLAAQQPLQSHQQSTSSVGAVLNEPKLPAILEPSSGSVKEAESDVEHVPAVPAVTDSTSSQEVLVTSSESTRASASRSLSGMTVAALREAAKSAGLRGFSKLKKADLIQLLLDNTTH